MKYEKNKMDSYVENNGRGKPITRREIVECAERFMVGDCVCIALDVYDFLVGKITTKTQHFLQVTPQIKNGYVRTFVYSDIILMGSRIKIITEQQMLELTEKVRKKKMDDCFLLFNFEQSSEKVFSTPKYSC